SILTIATLVAVANLSIFGLLREYTRHGTIGVGGPFSFPASPAPVSPIGAEQGFVFSRTPEQDEWEEAPKHKD
ncbi:MAG TPA: hypothetical protein VFV92_02345, partial [Candidatus Bathyarchaeia archaeon]|nr:hypothetical protein [Candidatus Bathyarchaeia archaeon]